MFLKIAILCFFLSSLLTACQSPPASDENPPAPGFDIEGSDHHAIVLADKIMGAMGGREAWDSTRYLQWTFFGRRSLAWDKKTGDVRIEELADSTIYLLNIHTLQGKVKRQGREITNPDTLKVLLKTAKSMWINDSYWLIMPFKLKDTGVTLKYRGLDTLPTEQIVHVLQLTFKNVGDTPQNKYFIFVDEESNLVVQWSYFKEAQQHDPDFTTPWRGYRRYGRILLSDDRGERKLTNISTPERLPNEIFTKF